MANTMQVNASFSENSRQHTEAALIDMNILKLPGDIRDSIMVLYDHGPNKQNEKSLAMHI